MVRWEPGAQESRDLQESCAAAAVLCPGLQVKTPLSTLHRPPRAPQVRSPSGPTRSSARVVSSPSCPSSFHISLVMPWLKTPCSHVLGLPRDDGSWAGAASKDTKIFCLLQGNPDTSVFPGDITSRGIPQAACASAKSFTAAAHQPSTGSCMWAGETPGKPGDSARKVRAAWLDLEGTWKEKSSAQNKTSLTHFQPGQVHCHQ